MALNGEVWARPVTMRWVSRHTLLLPCRVHETGESELALAKKKDKVGRLEGGGKVKMRMGECVGGEADCVYERGV